MNIRPIVRTFSANIFTRIVILILVRNGLLFHIAVTQCSLEFWIAELYFN